MIAVDTSAIIAILVATRTLRHDRAMLGTCWVGVAPSANGVAR